MTEEGMTENVNEHTQGHLLGAADIRRIAADAGISPTKKFGQNFVIGHAKAQIVNGDFIAFGRGHGFGHAHGGGVHTGVVYFEAVQ